MSRPTSSSSLRAARRRFLKTTAGVTAVGLTPYWLTAAHSETPVAKNDRPNVGCIGIGWWGSEDARNAKKFGNIVAVCDVDRDHLEKAARDPGIGDGKAQMYDDYRRLLERPDIDVVTVSTPDHWHSKISIEAMQAGKDVRCQKPMTLTIEEGQQICRVAKENKRVMGVGTQQRAMDDFLRARAMIQNGRLGKIKRVEVGIGGPPAGGPFKSDKPPAVLNWDMWQGQAPTTAYIKERTHGSFRFWYEYAGGNMTDWGGHHVDIAHWCLGKEDTSPVLVEGTGTFPVPFKDGYPTENDQYNTATAFRIVTKFADGVELIIRSDGDNGVLFEGEQGRIFVNRGRLTGAPVERLADDPLPEDALVKAFRGKPVVDHYQNFFDCVRDRSLPISDVFSHHRALTTCHLANIAIRLGRPIQWDPVKEEIIGDAQAAQWVRREQRKGYEIKV